MNAQDNNNFGQSGLVRQLKKSQEMNPTTNTSNEAPSKLLSDEELAEKVARIGKAIRSIGYSEDEFVENVTTFIQEQKQAWADKEVKAVLDEVSKTFCDAHIDSAIQSIRSRYE